MITKEYRTQIKPVAVKAVEHFQQAIWAEEDIKQHTQILWNAEFVCWSIQVLQPSADQTPLHHWPPKEHRLGTYSQSMTGLSYVFVKYLLGD